MPDCALDAEQMIRRMRERMGRDPSKTKQIWRFSWCIDGVIAETRANKIAQMVAEQIGGTFKLWIPPEFEFRFESDEGTPTRTVMECTFRSRMEVAQLTTLHKNFRLVADSQQMRYEGVSFFDLDDPRIDAHEMFLQHQAFFDRDLEQSPVQWKFCFEGTLEEPKEAAEAIVDQFVELAGEGAGSVEASLKFAEGASGDSHIIEISCFGCFTAAGLQKLHKRLRKAGKKWKLQYLGVEIDDASIGNEQSALEMSASFDDPSELFGSSTLSIADGISWTNEVIGKTAKFEFNSLPKVANKIRAYHLKKLGDIGMEAADWMPTADQRLENQLRPKSEIVKRLMGAYVCTAWVCAPPEVVSNEAIKNYLATNGLKKNAFSGKEAEWMQTSRSDVAAFAPNAGWVMENIWSLAWLLGYSHTPCVSGEMVDEQVFDPLRGKLMKGFDRTYDELMQKTKLRRLETVIALEDLLYCAHNSVRTTNVTHGGLMHERRQPLTWALSPSTSWDDTDVST